MPRWIRADLTDGADAPDAAGDPYAYVTPGDGGDTARVIYCTSDRHIAELRLEEGGTWKRADLTDGAGAPDARWGPMAYLTSFDEGPTARVVYLGTNSHIHELRLEPGASWKGADLTDLSGAPDAGSEPFGYVTSFDSDITARVVFRGTDGHIYELRLEPGGSWAGADLSAQADARAAEGAPFAYVTPMNSHATARVLYPGDDRHIHELRLEPGDPWKSADLTAQAGAPGTAGLPTAYLTHGDGAATARVVYRATDGHIHEIRLESGASWAKADLTDRADGVNAAGDPYGYVDSQETARVVYLGGDAHLHELRLEPGGTWKSADLTSQAGAPDGQGAPFAYLTAFGGRRTPRVLFRGHDAHIHELRLE